MARGFTFSSNDVSVYIHIPFCVRRCIYCDFVSTTRRDLIEDYFYALLKDIEAFDFSERIVKTIYIGGGTPSSVDASYIRNALERIISKSVIDIEEFTIELNPEDVSRSLVRDLKDVGMNRASLGVQAAAEHVLKISGRRHGVREVLKALDILMEELDNVNVDFIVGLPGSDMRIVERNLELVERYKPPHVSVYTLELHESTPLWKMVSSGKIRLPENTMEMFFAMKEGLESMGYKRYEISNFSLPGKESVHNMSYWLNLNYVGFGVSAGGHLNRFRYVKTLSVEEYVKNPFKNHYESHNDECTELKETLFMGLRLADGIPQWRLEEFNGEIVEEFLRRIENFLDGGLKLKDLDDSTPFEEVVNFKCAG